MPVTYDITKDFLYQEGEQRGEQRVKTEMVARMLRSGDFTTTQVARFADVSEEFVEQVAETLSKG